MGGKAFLSLFFCTLTSLLLGCSGESLSLYKSTRGGLTLPEVGQCNTSPYDGAMGFDSTGLHFTEEDTGYFDKSMVFDHLRALSKTSGFATWLYIRNLGIPISKVREKTQAQCQYFAFISSSSSKNESLWQDISSSDESRGKLLGLYTTILERSSNGVTRIAEQQIIVREDSHRWTLLHELGHHLFTASRVQTHSLLFDRELKENLEDVRNKIRSLKAGIKSEFSREKEALSLVKEWEVFFEISHKLHSRGPLEEFTLESLLLKEYMDDRLQFINDRTEPVNAVNYMNFSSRKVLLRYKSLIQSMKDFRAENFKDEWTAAQTNTQLIINKVNRQLQFIENKMKIAHNFKRNSKKSSQNRTTQMLRNKDLPKSNPTHLIPHYDTFIDQEHDQIYQDIF